MLTMCTVLSVIGHGQGHDALTTGVMLGRPGILSWLVCWNRHPISLSPGPQGRGPGPVITPALCSFTSRFGPDPDE